MAVVPLQYRVDGPRHAPAALFLGPLGTMMSVWDPQLAELARRFRTVRVNHRGHEESPAPAGDYSVSELGGDVLALLDRLELERVSIVGASFGGMIAMWLASMHPDRVHRLALVSTTAWSPPERFWRERANTVREKGTASVVGDVARHWFTPEFAEQSPGLVSRMTEEFSAVDRTAYAGCCDAIAAMDQRVSLTKARASSVVISAVHDPATPPGHGQRIAGRIAGARHEVIEGAAHLVSIEQPERLNHLLMEHLAH